MLRFFRKCLQFLTQKQSVSSTNPSPTPDTLQPQLEVNLTNLQEQLGTSPDVVTRRFNLGGPHGLPAALVYIDGLTDKTVINRDLLRPLLSRTGKAEPQKNVKPDLNQLEKDLVTAGEIKRTSNLDNLVDSVLSGDTALFLSEQTEALIVGTKGWEKRSIKEPDTEVIIKGPRDGFVETMRTNMALVRRRIGHPGLTFFALRIGRRTKTDVSIAYIKGIVKDELVEEVKRRLKGIKTDGILAAGFIEQYIEDAPYSPFPTVAWTERPDVAAAKLLEGRVAIFIDGTPVVNTVPMLFVENFQNPDDYNFRPFFATITRGIRYLAFTLSVLSPPLFVALTTFHQEMIPTPLLISMAAATEGTPFPAVVEVLGMGVVFEILREAGIRLPRPIGQAVSIVGALVIGEATVSAGLVGAPTVIVIAFTAIASFVVPYQNEVSTILRLSLTALAGVLGAYGIIGGLLLTLIHLASLRSFGIPYLAPIAPLVPQDLKDVLFRAPLWAMGTRPSSLEPKAPVRQSQGQRPRRPAKKGE